MKSWNIDIIINDIDQHQGKEADQEGDEDGQHHLGQPEVLLPLGIGNTILLARITGAVLLHIHPKIRRHINYMINKETLSSVID